MKSYKLITDNESTTDAQRTVEVTQERTKTHIFRTSLGQLQHDYDKLQRDIQAAAIKADAIVDEIDAIRTDLSLTMTLPSKMQDKQQGTIKVPIRQEDAG